MSEEETTTIYTCEHCNKTYKTAKGLAQHVLKKHICELNGHKWTFVRSEFKGRSDTGLRFYTDVYKCLMCNTEMHHEYHKT